MFFSELSLFFFFPALGLRCSLWASLAVMCRLSCPVACGISVLGPGIEPEPPALEGNPQPLDRQARPSDYFSF